jgi:type IX secretion system PorP/SprF family membrane protein
MKLKTMQVMPALNFHKSLSGNKNSYLSGGFMAGFVNRQFDGKNLTFDNQYTGGRYDPSTPSGENFTGLSRGFLDVALGLSYNSDLGENGSYYVGTSLWHFNKPSYSFLSDNIQLDPKWQFNGGARTWLNESVQLTVEGNYLMQGPYSEIIGGVMAQYYFDGSQMSDNPISEVSVAGGLFMRVGDALIPYVQVSYNHLDVGLSYDVNISSLKAASQGRGGFELSLTYRGFTKNPSSTLGNMRCPRF